MDLLKVYAGIGSRRAPKWALNEAVELATHLAKNGYRVRSGAAEGMDEAFEKGAHVIEKSNKEQLREIWVPWRGFRYYEHFDPMYQRYQTPIQRSMCGDVLVSTGILPDFFERPISHQKLHGRNVYQITGGFMDDSSKWSEFVIYWADEVNGIPIGGTRTAVQLARYLGIPTFNIANSKDTEKLYSLIKYTHPVHEW